MTNMPGYRVDELTAVGASPCLRLSKCLNSQVSGELQIHGHLAELNRTIHRSSILTECLQHSPAPSYELELHAEVPAAKARVFQAITIDEYVEMWATSSLRRNQVSCRTEPQVGGNYRLLVRRGGTQISEIKGNIVVYKPFSAIVCSIEASGFPLVPRSLVSLELGQLNDATLLTLRHTCIMSIEQADYFRTMWTASLRRLVRLFPRYLNM